MTDQPKSLPCSLHGEIPEGQNRCEKCFKGGDKKAWESLLFGHGPEVAEVAIRRKDGKTLVLIEGKFRQVFNLELSREKAEVEKELKEERKIVGKALSMLTTDQMLEITKETSLEAHGGVVTVSSKSEDEK